MEILQSRIRVFSVTYTMNILWRPSRDKIDVCEIFILVYVAFFTLRKITLANVLKSPFLNTV